MKQPLFALLIWILPVALIAQEGKPLDQMVALTLVDEPLEDAIKRLEDAGIARFSYNPQVLQGQSKVSITQEKSLGEILDDWLEGSRLRYKVVGQQVVIYRSTLPSSISKPKQVRGGASLSGYVVDQRSGERLPYAKVWDLRSGRGTVANAFGFFSMRLPEDSATIMGSFPEYLCHPVPLVVKRNEQVELPLQPYVDMQGVAIEAEKSSTGPEEVQMSVIALPVSEVNNMPSLLGEPDLVRAVQLLPGVQSGAEGTTGIYVRGGSPDQNLILLDGVPLYYVNHWGGFASVFNSDALSDVRLTKGGFPARFGGRLSSVMEVSMKEGNRKERQFAGSIGLLSVKASVQGPIGPKNEAGEAKTSYIVSGRRNYFDLINRVITQATQSEPDDGFLGYGFYDFNAKINHIFSEKDRLFISGYLGRDRNQTKQNRTVWTTPEDEIVVQNQAPPSYVSRNQVIQENLNDWGNAFAALRWNHVWNDRAFSNLNVSYSRYDFRTDTRFEQQTEEAGESVKTTRNTQEFSSEIRDAILRWEMDWYPTHRQQFKWGAQATLHEFEPGIRQTQTIINSETLTDTTVGNFLARGTEAFLFAEHDWHINNRLRVQTGLHAAGYRFRQRNYFSLQPRIAARAMLRERLSFKASYAEMQQFVHMLTNQTVGVPVDLWVPATDSVPPQYSRQLAAGLSWESVNGGWEASVEGYYKQMEDLIDYSEGYIDLTQDPTGWESLVEIGGEGLAYGGELFLQKKRGPLRGWLSYTLSWNWRTFDNINEGKRYPFRYDRRHDFSIVALYTLRPGIELSATWVYGTGQSITLPTGRHESWIQDRMAFPRLDDRFSDVEGDIFLYEGGRNNVRMRAFHRLDLGISLTKEKPWGQRIWRLGLYNAYSRRNPFYYYYDKVWDDNSDQARNALIQFSLFPITPSISYGVQF